MTFRGCRLLKYPLLLQNLEKYTESGTEELLRVQQAEERSKEISNFVDASVKVAEDQHRLAEIQRRLDKSLFDKVDHAVATEFRVSTNPRLVNMSDVSAILSIFIDCNIRAIEWPPTGKSGKIGNYG